MSLKVCEFFFVQVTSVLLVALNASMGIWKATVNDMSVPDGKRSDLFRLDLGLASRSRELLLASGVKTVVTLL